MELDELIEQCRCEVEDGGFSVAALVADASGCDWAYTIGLHRSFGHPELLVVGIDAPIAGVVLEVLGNRIAAGEHLSAENRVRMDGGLEFELHRVDQLFCAQGDWFNLGREVMSSWGERWPTSLQLTWSDPAEGFPTTAGDPAWSLRQPLLFSA